MKILLLEPKYKNKYPPIGLMKIARFHNRRNDEVKFCKMEIPEEYYIIKWDMVYVTTLFTFEWEKTIECIKSAIKLVRDNGRIIIGGILATLLEDELNQEISNLSKLDKKIDIQVLPKQLNKRGKLGLLGDEFIDTLPLDYSILKQIDYKYPWSNAFYAYMTRGCGMNCEFCAVKTLEPKYKQFISIKNNIKTHRDENNDKRNLLLLDNNVMVSRNFKEIIQEIIDLGFGKGAHYIKPDTGSKVKRYVDFNQGLDANLMTEEKVKELSKIAIRPARIAFDHISGKKKYIEATKLCAKYGIDNFSNYMLFNTNDFKGKGQKLDADKPRDLYNRMEIAIDLKKKLNDDYSRMSINMYSFPMRFKPLDARQVGHHIGKNWNKKYLRAVQVMLNPTMGKGVSSESYFRVAFGSDVEEFIYNLKLPESLLVVRGKILRRIDDTDIDYKKRINSLTENSIRYKLYYEHFYKLYKKIEDNKLTESLIEIIHNNNFSTEKYFSIKNKILKEIYLFYLSNSKLGNLMYKVINKEENSEMQILKDFFDTKIGKVKMEELLDYSFEKQISKNKLFAFYYFFGEIYFDELVYKWVYNDFENSHIINRLNSMFTLIIESKIKNFRIEKKYNELKFYLMIQNFIDDEDNKDTFSRDRLKSEILDSKRKKILEINDLEEYIKKNLKKY